MGTYTTVQGDEWDAIAWRELGSTAHTGALMAANRQYWDVFVFPAGVVLTLPEVKTQTAFDLATPPWKRADT